MQDSKEWRQQIEGTSAESQDSKAAANVRSWLAEALRDGSELQLRYRIGEYDLGKDVEQFLWAFDEAHLRKDPTRKEQLARRRRAYHFLLAGVMANYEYSAAREIRKQLKAAEETFWLRWRHFILWRLMVAAIAGNIALGGSAHWMETTKRFAVDTCGWGVACMSILFLVAPAMLADCFQAPTQVLRNTGEYFLRLRMVLLNALAILLGIFGVQWALAWRYTPPGSAWRDPKIHIMMAAVSLAIGYVLNLFWRERPIAGPGS